MSKSALIEREEGGNALIYAVTEIEVHASGALIIPRDDETGTIFAPGTWTRADLIDES